jgi:hypothetical protein
LNPPRLADAGASESSTQSSTRQHSTPGVEGYQAVKKGGLERKHTLKPPKEEKTHSKMGLSKGGFDILQGPDKAETGRSSGDPIMRKLRSTLLDGKEKYSGSKDTAVKILAEITRIGE